jgi:hypothetical protein
MNTQELTGLQKMQIAYAHFTLEEWHLLAKCVSHVVKEARDGKLPQGHGVTQNKVHTMLAKFPSAVL